MKLENSKSNQDERTKWNRIECTYSSQNGKRNKYKPVSIGSRGLAEMLEFTYVCDWLRLLAFSGPCRNDWDLQQKKRQEDTTFYIFTCSFFVFSFIFFLVLHCLLEFSLALALGFSLYLESLVSLAQFSFEFFIWIINLRSLLNIAKSFQKKV